MQKAYRPEIDDSPELEPVKDAYYQSLIGILQWMVDIYPELLILSSHMDLRRQGNLNQVFHIFAFPEKYHNTKLVFDFSDPCFEESDFELKDWKSSEFGPLQGTQDLPPNMTQPRGLGFITSTELMPAVLLIL